MNKLIAQIISAQTASERFGGCQSGFKMSTSPFRHLHFNIPSFLPLTNPDGIYSNPSKLSNLVASATEQQNQMITARPSDYFGAAPDVKYEAFSSSILFRSTDGLLLQKQANQIYNQITSRGLLKVAGQASALSYVSST